MANMNKPTPEMKAWLRGAVSADTNVATANSLRLAKALQEPIKVGIMNGDIVSDIFDMDEFEPGQNVEYPIDIVTPENVGDFIAYSMPNHGAIPERHVEGDYITL